MVYLHTGPMGVYRACFFIARAGRAATPERNRSGNQPPILCILPLVAHQLASARDLFLPDRSAGLPARRYRKTYGRLAARRRCHFLSPQRPGKALVLAAAPSRAD